MNTNTTEHIEVVAVSKSPPTQSWSILTFLKSNMLLVVFAALVIIGATTSEYFLTPLNMANLLRSMVVPGILALGMTFVLLVARIDLSVAALMIFAPIVGVAIMDVTGDIFGFRVLVRGNSYAGSAVALIAIALITGPVIGFITGIGVVYGRITSFIMTLAMMQALRGLNYVLTNGHAYYLQVPGFTWIGKLQIFGVPFSFVIFTAICVLAMLVLRYTIVGRRLMAIGGDEKAALLAGINVKFWVIFTFVISGFCAGLAGILFTSRLQSVDAPLALGFELTAIAFAVVGGVSLSGGRGSPYRTFLGALVISTMLNVFNMWGLNTWYQNIATGGIVILVVMIDRFTRERQRNTLQSAV
ncbi:MAG: ABC transporter permease [Hyphomicrobiales bacterium]|nr:ABC transporter permease [Hyphomicrobiales bacterium]